jgi:hypothetical protein
MRRIALALIATLAATGGAVSFAVAASGRGDGGAQRFGDGQFASPCRFSHRLPDDPIVFPRRHGASHSHDFFGATTTNADSTRASMLRGGTTCRRPRDRAGYWVPTLYQHGRAVTPLKAQIYYRTAGRDPRTIRPFPAGLMVIAGDARAQAPQERRIASWYCGSGAGMRESTTVPACPPGSRLRLRVRFPDCWDGQRLDSTDHKSHMAYSDRVPRRLRQGGAPRRCPASHPVAVPRLVLNVVYPVAGGSGITLASGPSYTAHADFFNAWEQRALATLVRSCLNADRHCGSGRRR